MKNYILGSGLIALLAKKILGDNWDIIPYNKSRYYSFKIPLADNDIIWSDKIDMSMYGTPILSKRAFSYCGELIFGDLPWVKNQYVEKLFGEIDQLGTKLLPTVISRASIQANELYSNLLREFLSTIKANEQYGHIKSIENNKIITTNKILPYDNIISTIPLNILFQILQINSNLQSKAAYCYHIMTDQLDFEGAERVYVIDKEIEFYQANQLDKYNYVLFAFNEIKNASKYFPAFMNNSCEIVNQTCIPESIPIGNPNIDFLKDLNIYCIGSNAQWDYWMDISSCINRILKHTCIK